MDSRSRSAAATPDPVETKSGEGGFTLAHLSDLHVTPVELEGPADLLGKRLLGWLSWRRKRRDEHRPEVLEALIADLAEQQPDQLAVTGDLTHLGLASEIAQARPWLERLGPPERVSLVPGNHDAYARDPSPDPFAPWAEYLHGEGRTRAERFPSLRRRGPLALVGLCSARPTAPGLASGRLGRAQLEALDRLLARLAGGPCFRVVLLHHPPLPAGQSRRRALDDAAALRDVLRRRGAELVLHGHTHRTHVAALEGPHGPIPTVGVPSGTSVSRDPARRARYHLFRIEPADPRRPEAGFTLTARVRALDAEGRRFVQAGSLPL